MNLLKDFAIFVVFAIFMADIIYFARADDLNRTMAHVFTITVFLISVLFSKNEGEQWKS